MKEIPTWVFQAAESVTLEICKLQHEDKVAYQSSLIFFLEEDEDSEEVSEDTYHEKAFILLTDVIHEDIDAVIGRTLFGLNMLFEFSLNDTAFRLDYDGEIESEFSLQVWADGQEESLDFPEAPLLKPTLH